MTDTWVTLNQLDTPLCDIFPGTITAGTVREYVRISEKVLGWIPKNIDRMGYVEMNEYVDLISYKINIQEGYDD